MNIALVVHYFDRAEGTGGYVVELARRFAREHTVTVYAAGIRTPAPDGVRVVRVPALRGRAYATILTFPGAFAAVRGRHDVVHAQGWVTGAADVATAHIVLGAWRESARAAGIAPPPGERWLGGFVARREQRFLTHGARLVIAPSHRARRDLARLYGREEDVAVIPHGFPDPAPLPPRAEARARLGIPAGEFVALYAGDARKGFAPAAHAVAGAPRVVLLVASWSRPDAYLAHARRAGLADRVHWAGGLRDIAQAYAAADVLLYPTIYDTFALVVAEALSHGLPVIVGPEAGITDLLEHGRSAWIIGPGARDAGAALVALRSDAALRERLAAQGRVAAAARGWDHVARETIAAYHRALEARGG